MKNIKYKKGEMYISTCISLLIIIITLVFLFSCFSLISEKITLDRISNSICEYVSVRGEINDDTQEYINELKNKTNMDFNCSFECEYIQGTSKIQLGNNITCNLVYSTSIFNHEVSLYSTNSKLSRVYFK